MKLYIDNTMVIPYNYYLTMLAKGARYYVL